MTTNKPKIAIIGAGWSGLAAAIFLSSHADITLYEASKIAGGRARALGVEREDFAFVDNGQHLMLGAYHTMREIMQMIGVDTDAAFLKQPLQWHLADGMQFQTDYPSVAPWHLLKGIFHAKNLSLGNKIALIKQMHHLKKRHQQPDESIKQWLQKHRCSDYLIQNFWQPMVYGALNTPLENASINTLANVLRDGVWKSKEDSYYWIPKQSLSALFAEPAIAWLQQQNQTIEFSKRVSSLKILPEQHIAVADKNYQAVITAVAPYHTAFLMPSEIPSDIQHNFENQQYHAITTVYLRYNQTVNLPAIMTGLANGTAQWFIDRHRLLNQPNEVVAIISVSDQISSHYTQEQWTSLVHQDLLRICPHLSEPIASQVMTEKRATIASVVNRQIPNFEWLHHHRIFPTGDWLHPHYPATLEAAVQNGKHTAQLVLQKLGVITE